MILCEHIPSYQRLAPYMQPGMLMLGRQTNTCGWKAPCFYSTMDPDGGDFSVDLSIPLPSRPEYEQAWQTVFNLGTLEHVWDIHQAYLNAASMVAKGGHFLGQSPVAGWEGHGIHVTEWKFISEFFAINGFELVDGWFTTQAGNPCDPPKRNMGKSVLYWFIMRRSEIVSFWKKPSQIYQKGVKP